MYEDAHSDPPGGKMKRSAKTTSGFTLIELLIVIVVIGILGFGGYLHRVALRQGEPVDTILSVIYFAIPHLEWYDVRDFLVHDWGLISWAVCAQATLYGLLYDAFFLGATWLVFRRKTLTV